MGNIGVFTRIDVNEYIKMVCDKIFEAIACGIIRNPYYPKMHLDMDDALEKLLKKVFTRLISRLGVQKRKTREGYEVSYYDASGYEGDFLSKISRCIIFPMSMETFNEHAEYLNKKQKENFKDELIDETILIWDEIVIDEIEQYSRW